MTPADTATSADIDGLLELAPRMLANAVHKFGSPIAPADWRAALESLIGGGGRAFVVRDEGRRIVGALLVGASGLAFNSSVVVVQVLTLWVSPGARCAGHARTMLESATEWAREIGAVAMVAGVPTDYEGQRIAGDACSPVRAERVYTRNGFALSETVLIKAVR